MAVPFPALALAALLVAPPVDTTVFPRADSARADSTAAVATARARADSIRADSTRATAARPDSLRFEPSGALPTSARYLPPAGATYVAEEVRVRTAERYSLAGTLVLPWRPVSVVPQRVRFPVVVLVGDGGPHNRDHTPADSLDAPAGVSYRPFAEIADTLARIGVATLRLDDRGVGSSTGTLANADPLDLTYDLRAALDYLRRRPEIDRTRVAFLGVGEGALCVAMLGRFEADLAALVLVSSPADPGRRLAEIRSRTAEWAKRVQSSRAARFLDTYDPIGTARTLRAPVLLLEGGADDGLPPGSAARLAAATRDAGNADVTLREFPNLTHRLLPAQRGGSSGQRLPREVLGVIAGWVSRQIGKPRPAPATPPPVRRR